MALPTSRPQRGAADQTPQEQGFFQKMLALFGIRDPDAEKKKLLKSIAKKINHSRYKFYKPKTSEALPGLARFFYETYKTIAPSQVMLTNAAQSGALKTFVIESFFSKDQKQYADLLTDVSVREKAGTMSVAAVQEYIKQTTAFFSASFDSEKTAQIDSAYSTIISFTHFINFDFFFLVKKFDSNITEGNFTYNPRFEAISGDYIADDIHDFLEVFLPLNLDADWKRIFAALKEYKGTDVIQIDGWLKLAPALKDVRNSGILENILTHLKANPDISVSPRVYSEHIVEAYIDKLKNQAALTMQKIVQERRNSKIDEFVRAIFGTQEILRLKNYTEAANIAFSKKKIQGFTYTQPLMYLKAYLIDYFKKDIRELADVLLIRGQWATNEQSQRLSDSYHTLLDVSEAVLQFDNSIGEDGELGAKIRTVLMRSSDRETNKYVQQIISDVNEQAKALINKGAVTMIHVGRHLKALIDDIARPRHEIIINWKEVENASELPLRGAMTEAYKKIYYMVQLLQYYVKDDKD